MAPMAPTSCPDRPRHAARDYGRHVAQIGGASSRGIIGRGCHWRRWRAASDMATTGFSHVTSEIGWIVRSQLSHESPRLPLLDGT
jgi:hypothetical protein